MVRPVLLVLVGVSFAFELFAAQVPFSSPEEYYEILDDEKRLLEMATQLKEEGYSAADFVNQIVIPLNAGESLTGFRENYLIEFNDRNYQFTKRQYAEIARKQRYFMTVVRERLEQLRIQLEQEKRLTSALLVQFGGVEKEFNKWEPVQDKVGGGVTPKEQRQRMYSFGGFANKVEKLLTSLHSPERAEPTGLPFEEAVEEPAASARRKVQGSFRTAFAGSYLSLQIVTRSVLSGLNQNLNPFHFILPKSWRRKVAGTFHKNSTPLLTGGGANSFFKGLTDIQGYQVKVEGRDNLRDIPLNGVSGKKVVNLFLPTHRHPMVDAMVMSHLDLPHFLIFANPKAFAGNIPLVSYVSASMLAMMPEFISVGQWRGFPTIGTFCTAVGQSIQDGKWTGVHGKEPTEKLLKALEEKRSPNVINYPQGFVSNAGEILPIHGQFAEKLVGRLLEEGFEVNVVPVSYEVDSDFFSKSGSVDTVEVSARFLPPLLHSTVKVLVEKQIASIQSEGAETKNRFFDHYLASIWYENIQKNSELSLNEMLNRVIYKGLLKRISPVRDLPGLSDGESLELLPLHSPKNSLIDAGHSIGD